ncbi:sarcosine oxidase subunit gamma [Aquisalimonas asiatica]|uniref:Sarcosine oxidase subunit gamma n=1 Tax=Aquisalimonas asiatica TaxID=406100 RepID=A0A1H8UUS2_9GAMM|nr:sarcosine oxidase subunit gamma family protein [Aquisalimonas asiatica]SEP06970.1 sarcosine oxidase subunit gamma [Aquisalimonas asiatica]
MTDVPARSPLTDPDLPAFAGVALRSVVPADILNLRGNADEPAFVDAVTSALGCPPPVTPNTWAAGEGLQLLWAGPDEWLAVVEPHGPAGRLEAVRGALGTTRGAVTALGAGYAMLELTGERSRAVLARGTPLDLHAREFAAGQCAQTRLGHGTVVLWALDGAPTFRLLIRRSMAGYLRDWLTAVARRTESRDGAASTPPPPGA